MRFFSPRHFVLFLLMVLVGALVVSRFARLSFWIAAALVAVGILLNGLIIAFEDHEPTDHQSD